jgi:hypothetical protein
MDADERDEQILQAERAALRARYGRRAETAIRLVVAIGARHDGYRQTALRAGSGRTFPFPGIVNAEIFTREVAPVHHRVIEGLLNVLAVACERADGRAAAAFKPRQLAQLHHRYRQLTPEQERWARAELRRPPGEQLTLFE